MKSWQKKEKRNSTDFGARRTPRSGGLWFCKGDSRNGKFLVESKATIHKGFTVTERLWAKLEREGLMSGRTPILSVGLGNGTELVILDKNDFIGLVEGRWKPN